MGGAQCLKKTSLLCSMVWEGERLSVCWIALQGKPCKDDTVDKGSWLRFRSLRLGLCCSVGFFFSTQLKVDTDTFCVILIQKVSRFCSQAPSLY